MAGKCGSDLRLLHFMTLKFSFSNKLQSVSSECKFGKAVQVQLNQFCGKKKMEKKPYHAVRRSPNCIRNIIETEAKR